MFVRQDVDTGIINIPVLKKVYFYRISNLSLNMEFQHIRGEPLLLILLFLILILDLAFY